MLPVDSGSWWALLGGAMMNVGECSGDLLRVGLRCVVRDGLDGEHFRDRAANSSTSGVVGVL
jgi:hypothetical protein